MSDHSSAIDALPPVSHVVKSLSLDAKKSLGQNFLFDLNLTRRIARAALSKFQLPIIEIGPGPGGLTRALLLEGAPRVTAIEKDKRFISALAPLVTAASGHLTIIEADALKVSLDTIADKKPYQVIANLPYNIGTELIVEWIKTSSFGKAFTVMLQREVVDRILAAPHTKDYGRLSIICQWRYRGTRVMDVPPSAFVPAPKVYSSVVQLIPRDDIDLTLLPYLERITAAAFGQRRKMLRQSLKSIWGSDTESTLTRLNIDPTRRAETLSLQEFLMLASHLI